MLFRSRLSISDIPLISSTNSQEIIQKLKNLIKGLILSTLRVRIKTRKMYSYLSDAGLELRFMALKLRKFGFLDDKVLKSEENRISVIRTATVIETNKDGSISYFKDDKAGYIPSISEGKIPYLWPEDIVEENYDIEEIRGWKLSLYDTLENSILDKLYTKFKVSQYFILKVIGKKLRPIEVLHKQPFWSKKLSKIKSAEHFNSVKEHDSLINFLNKSLDLGRYIWIDGQPMLKLEEGKYMAVDDSQPRGKNVEKESQRIFNAKKENFEDYLNKEWSVKQKESERRISE